MNRKDFAEVSQSIRKIEQNLDSIRGNLYWITFQTMLQDPILQDPPENISTSTNTQYSWEPCVSRLVQIWWLVIEMRRRIKYLRESNRHSFQTRATSNSGFRMPVGKSTSIAYFEELQEPRAYLLQGCPCNVTNPLEILQNTPYIAKHTLFWMRRGRPIVSNSHLLKIYQNFQELHENYLMVQEFLEPKATQ